MAEVAVETNNRTWFLVEEVFPEAEINARQRWAQYMGSIAIRGEAQLDDVELNNESTLLRAIEGAASGNERDGKVVRKNVHADVLERMYKVGLSEAELEMKNGKLEQDGRELTSIHRSTLEHTILVPEMMRRTTQELNIAMIVEELHSLGVMKDNDVVVCSPTSTIMTLDQKKQYNFFTDTETCLANRFSAEGGRVKLQTAYIAGKPTPTSPRQDIETIRTLAASKGIAIPTKDGTEILQYVMVVPKSELPNGIIDFVKQWDDVNGTFYGEAKPRQDYIKHALQCKERALALTDIVEQITEQLIKDAPAFNRPLDAIMRLDELSERFCVKHAVEAKDINTAVFGSVSASHLEQARYHWERGEFAKAEKETIKAQNTAISGSCPLFKGSYVNPATNNSGSSNNLEKTGKRWMSCPHCKAKVFADPCANVLSCWDCKARVVNGRMSYKGNGGSKARDAKKAEELKRQKEQTELAKQVDAIFEEKSKEETVLSANKPITAGV